MGHTTRKISAVVWVEPYSSESQLSAQGLEHRSRRYLRARSSCMYRRVVLGACSNELHRKVLKILVDTLGTRRNVRGNISGSGRFKPADTNARLLGRTTLRPFFRRSCANSQPTQPAVMQSSRMMGQLDPSRRRRR
eukprot:2353248-Prymnesium_polylepis.1